MFFKTLANNFKLITTLPEENIHTEKFHMIKVSFKLIPEPEALVRLFVDNLCALVKHEGWL